MAVAAWPLTAVAAIGYLAAWLRGWPPARLWRAAAWALPMTAVYAIGQAIRLHAWQAVALAPVQDYGNAWRLLAAGAILRAGLLVAPVAVPAGLAIGGLLWAWRIYAITTGLAGLTASAPIEFDTRQWRRQVRAARGRAAAPGTVPLLTRSGQVVIGPVIRAIRHKWRPILTVPARSFSRHSVIIGSSGSGKTNLMMRLWAGWYAATHTAHLRGEGDRPLLVVLDCKGGPDARVKAERTRRLLHGVGARRVAIWPDEARLCLWDLPPRDLGVLLLADDRDRGRGRRLLHRRHASRRQPRPRRPRRPARQRRQLPGPPRRGLAGDRLRRRPARRRPHPHPRRQTPRRRHPAPLRDPAGPARPGPRRARETWRGPMPGTASWKAPASNPSPKRRPWP